MREEPVLEGVPVQLRFGDHVLDSDRRELWRGSDLIAVEPQVFDLIVYLVNHRHHVVTKQELLGAVWGGRIVSESTLTSRINAARRAVGDNGKAQHLIRTLPRKGFRFLGTVTETAERPRQVGTSHATRESEALGTDLKQTIQFCTAADGVRIAYAQVGRGRPLVKAANWLNHLEYDWRSPIWSHLLQALAANHHLIRYDARGNGLSDWDVTDISFEAFVRDLETVVAAVGLERFALLGISQGCAISIAYAVRHPERVSHLVLYGGFARGRRKRGGPGDVQESDALLTLMHEGWGQENPAFRHIFTSLFLPGGTAEQMQWFDDLQRITTSPANAVRIRRTVEDIEITDLLPRVRVPTLVLHCRNDAMQPFDEGRRIAAGIPGARFVGLEGRNHLLLESDPAWPRFLDEVGQFLRQELPPFG